MPLNDLEHRLLKAHETADKTELIDLYCEASAISKDDGAKSFYLTHAYVFALETGDPRGPGLKKQLVDMGREVPD